VHCDLGGILNPSLQAGTQDGHPGEEGEGVEGPNRLQAGRADRTGRLEVQMHQPLPHRRHDGEVYAGELPVEALGGVAQGLLPGEDGP